MSVDLEWIEGKAGIIRWGEDFQKHGDPYEFVVSVDFDEETKTAELKGAVGHITTKGQREIFRILKKNGVEKILWERKNKQKNRKIEAKSS